MSNPESNRLNSQNSTGPKTEEGKARSRFNAFRHGLTGQTVVMPWEDADCYVAHCAEFMADLKPEGMLEKQLVQTIADTSWRLNRAAAQETNILWRAIDKTEDEYEEEDVNTAFAMARAFLRESQLFNNISLYGQRLSRQREKAIDQLRQLQAERRKTEPRPKPEPKPAIAPPQRSGDGFVLSTTNPPSAEPEILPATALKIVKPEAA